MTAIKKISTVLTSLLVCLFSSSLCGQTYLQNGQRYVRELDAGIWSHFYVNIDGTDSEAVFRLIVISGNPDIYVRHGAPPTLTEWDFRPYEDPSGRPMISPWRLELDTETVTVNESSTPALQNGEYFVSVHAQYDGAFPGHGGSRFKHVIVSPGYGGDSLRGRFNVSCLGTSRGFGKCRWRVQ